MTCPKCNQPFVQTDPPSYACNVCVCPRTMSEGDPSLRRGARMQYQREEAARREKRENLTRGFGFVDPPVSKWREEAVSGNVKLVKGTVRA